MLFCRDTKTGHSKHTCTQTQKASCYRLSLDCPTPPPPLLFFFFACPTPTHLSKISTNVNFSIKILLSLLSYLHLICLPCHNAIVVYLRPRLFPWGQGLCFVDHSVPLIWSSACHTTDCHYLSIEGRREEKGRRKEKKKRRKRKKRREERKQGGREEPFRGESNLPAAYCFLINSHVSHETVYFYFLLLMLSKQKLSSPGLTRKSVLKYECT